MNFKIIDFLILVGVIQGFFFAISILFSKFFKSKANIYLGISILIGVFSNINHWALHYGWYEDHLNYRIIEDIEFVLLFPVTLYFYYVKFLNIEHKLSKTSGLLYLPFIISLIVNLYVGGNVYYDLYPIANTNWISPFYGIEYYFSILFNIVLLVVEFRLLVKARKTRQRVIDNDFKWIHFFYGLHVFLIVFWVLVDVIDSNLNSDYSFIFWLFLNFIFYWIGYRGIFKFQLARNRYEIRRIIEKEEKDGNTEKKDVKINVDNPHFEKMIHLLENDKLYRNPKLSREDVADKLGISIGYLSQIINTVSEKSFSDFLNYYRVEEAKTMIVNNEFDQYNIAAIGLEAGFNSKSSFYTCFKKQTGHTPSAYRKLN